MSHTHSTDNQSDSTAHGIALYEGATTDIDVETNESIDVNDKESDSEDDALCDSESDEDMQHLSDCIDSHGNTPAVSSNSYTLCVFLNYLQLKFHFPDKGMQILLRTVMTILSSIVEENLEIKQIAMSFPMSLYEMRKALFLNPLVHYAMCPKCDMLCCDIDSAPLLEQTKCKYVAFPNHPHASHRTPCDKTHFKVNKVL